MKKGETRIAKEYKEYGKGDLRLRWDRMN